MGRLLKIILKLTDPKRAIYLETSMGFFDSSGREILTMKGLGLLYRCIGVSGINGLDRLLAFRISKTFDKIFK